MATLTKERHLSGQKPRMVTSMHLMTIQTVLWYRRMFKGIGTSLFGMAFVTEIIYRIGLEHCFNIKRAHRVVTTRAFKRLPTDKFLFYWMVGLFVELGSYVPVAAKAEVRFWGFQIILSRHSRMDGMTVVTRDKKRFVLAEIPVLYASHIFVTGEAF